MYRRAFIISLSVVLTLSMALLGCGKNEEATNTETETETEKLLIYTSIYPLYFFAQEIAGDRAEVVNLIPAGSEPA